MVDEMGFDEFKKLEQMFPDGFLIMHVRPNGLVKYAKFNPRRVECIELWEQHIMDAATAMGPNFWKGFISKDEIPDYPPKEWNNLGNDLEDVDLPPNGD